MPQLLEHIDEIARRLNRNVLMLTFNQPSNDPFESHWKAPPACKKIIRWLKKNGIGYSECFERSDGGFIIQRYQGQLYIDLPFNEDDPTYQKLRHFLEYPDGSVRFAKTQFWTMTLNVAQWIGEKFSSVWEEDDF